jgi:hypothetical protein
LPVDLLPRTCLAIREGVTTSLPTKPVCRGAVTVGCAPTMLRVVLPAIAAATSRELRWTVACTTNSANSSDATRAADTSWTAGTANAAYASRTADTSYSTDTSDSANSTDASDSANAAYSTHTTRAAAGELRWTVNIRIAVEVVVVVDRDVVAAPAATTAPAAAPEGAHHDADAERDRQSCCVVSRGRVVDRRIWVYRRSVYDRGIVGGHIDDLGIRLLNDNRALVLDDLRFHLLLLSCFQIAGVLRLFAHPLHGSHYLSLLGQERVPKVGGPLDVVRQALHQIWQAREGLNARVPGLFGYRIRQRFVLESGIFFKPLLQLNDLEWIGRRCKGLSKHWIGEQRDWRD